MSPSRPDISIVVCAWNMERELQRTLFSLSSQYQRGVEAIEYEILVIDNGSTVPLSHSLFDSLLPRVKIIRIESADQSPANALNEAIKTTSAPLIGVFVDGARILTPGIISKAFNAWKSDPESPIATLSFHLGVDLQVRTIKEGYDSEEEGELLSKINWPNDGYRLFEISVLAESSRQGWFGNQAETNGLFIGRERWNQSGGFDVGFKSPGGGYMNLDLWKRIVETGSRRPWMILGEGTFHQVHGGAATNRDKSERTPMRSEYRMIRGSDYRLPTYQSKFVGELNECTFEKGFPKKNDDKRKVFSVKGRSFRVELPGRSISTIQKGTLRSKYKGLRLAKNPFDLAIYRQLFEELKPRSVIEIGTSEEGNTHWFRDQLNALKLTKTKIVSIDRDRPKTRIKGVAFYKGDANRPGETFPVNRIRTLPHPWVIIDDGAHTEESVGAILSYFHPLLNSGDVIVIEDGVVADPDGKYSGDPNVAVAEFLLSHGDQYRIAEEYCDRYGPNFTWAPNGWLVRV